MTDLPSIIARLEAATGPDREIDAALHWYLLEQNRDERSLAWVTFQFSLPETGDWRAPYTASLDACAALQGRVLPGWTRSVDATAPHLGVDVTLHAPGIESPKYRESVLCSVIISGTHAVETHAWLIAILRAVEAERARGLWEKVP